MPVKQMERTLLQGMIKKTIVVILIGFIAWAYKATQPPPPKICGSPNGPPITAPRIKLRDGRHLAYKEHGVPNEIAKYKIISVHGFGCSRYDVPVAVPELFEKLGVYLVSYDRQGHGESDPHPERTIKSTALDIEELADQLGFGPKFYVIGFSMGSHSIWGCLKYIPHRLAGATLVSPVMNYWWGGFPKNLSTEAYYQQLPQDQWALRVAHYLPWLNHWWNTQKWFPPSAVIAGKAKFSSHDFEIISKVLAKRTTNKEYATQQGEMESIIRDLMIGFGRWEFDPMDIENPFPNKEGFVNLWHGDEDGLVPVALPRYIAGRLPWIHYHEVPGCGHLFSSDYGHGEAIIKALVLGLQS